MKVMNHGEYQRKMKTKTVAELRFIIQDANEAIKANPQGENSGYYMDEVHYAASELRKRSGLAA